MLDERLLAFGARLSGAHVTKSDALEFLVIASSVRGLPVRDVGATLAEAPGDQAAISRFTVSAICAEVKGEYQAWAARRLDEVKLGYLFLDASFVRMHPGSPASPLLVISDGSQGLICAFEQVYPKALCQRCLIQRASNRRPLPETARQLQPCTVTAAQPDGQPETVRATA